MSHPLLIILKASRPLGWIFGPILYIIGIIHSRVYPRTPAALALAALQIFSLSLPLCIGEYIAIACGTFTEHKLPSTVVFGVNDVYDYQSDLVNPRKIAAGLEGGILPPQYHAMVLKVSYLSAIFVVAVGILSRQWGTIIATLSLIFLGFQYSSPPLRLKEVPVIDSITNGVIVFLCWFIGLTARGAIQHPSLRRKGFVIGLVVSAIHALGASVDIESDMAAGQRTIATLLGPRLTAVVGVLA